MPGEKSVTYPVAGPPVASLENFFIYQGGKGSAVFLLKEDGLIILLEDNGFIVLE